MNPPVFPAGGGSQPNAMNGLKPKKSDVLSPSRNQFHPNQSTVPQIQKSWSKAGLEEVKKDTGLTVANSLIAEAGTIFFILKNQIQNRKISISSVKTLLRRLANWLITGIGVEFTLGVCKNKKDKKTPPASPVENGIKEMCRTWPAWVVGGLIFPLTTWLTRSSERKLPFSSVWKNGRWILPVALVGGSAIAFGAGVYQFGKPPNNKSS